jgi:pSer/pThr/pTyr-binding forkhead associated (FHA) protein
MFLLPKTGGYVEVVKPIAAGRLPTCGIHIADLQASREHCLFYFEGTQLWLLDLSQNGTFVNGSKVGKNKHQELQSGDVIAIAGWSATVSHALPAGLNLIPSPANLPMETYVVGAIA